MNYRYALVFLFGVGTLALIYNYPRAMLNPGELVKGHQKISNDCFKCHAAFSGTPEKLCVECHKLEKIDRFKVDGSHLPPHKQPRSFEHRNLKRSECTLCHTDHKGLTVKTTVRSFSHQLLNKSDLNNCISCHKNPSDELHKKTTQNCMECHSTERWKPARFEHTKYFRFDRYHPARCNDCHQQQNYKTFTCYGCHEHSPRNIRSEHLEEGIHNYERCEKCHRSGDEDEAERLWRKMKREGKLPDAKPPIRPGYYDDDDHDDDD